MQNVKNNRFFKNAKQRAARLLENKDKLNRVLKAAASKISKMDLRQVKSSAAVERLGIMSRMIKGDYRAIKTSNIILLIAAIVYFVMPLDLIPDFVPITGFADDFSIIIWVYNKLQEEIDDYMIWEQNLKYEK